MPMTTIPVAAGEAMERVDAFLTALRATAVKRKGQTVKANIVHPDGFAARVCITYYPVDSTAGAVEVLRRCGDGLLYGIIFKKLIAFLDRGEVPAFYDGQMMPRPIRMQYSLPPAVDMPTLRLDSGVKRNAGEMVG